MTTATQIDRTLTFEIAHNVRHMGGYRTRDGRETRPTIVRAASLHRLTDAGVDSFVAAGIRTVIDFRSEKECDDRRTPNMEAHGVRHIFAPVFRSDASPAGLGADFTGFGPVYQKMLHSGAGAYRTLLEVVAEADGGVLFHCAAGKDRTGVLCALTLLALGVDEADVTADYELTNLNAMLDGVLVQAAARYAKRIGRPIEPEEIRPMIRVERAFLDAALGAIAQRSGSVDAYLEDMLGLDDARRKALAANLLAA